MRRSLAEARCLRLAAEQQGLIAYHQALALGMSRFAIRRRVESGRWSEPFPKVFLIGGSSMSWRTRVQAGRLYVADGCVASHTTAGTLHKLYGCNPGEIEVTWHSNHRRPAVDGIVIHRTKFLPDDDVCVVDGIPATSPARTILDYSGRLSSSQARRVILDAVDRAICTPELLLDQLTRAARSGRNGSHPFRRALETIDWDLEQTDSDLEDECCRLLICEGYPEPTRHHRVAAGNALLAEVDLAYPLLRLGIECHSYAYHSGRAEFDRDAARLNALLAAGWLILHFTYADSVRPLRFLTELERAWALVHTR